MTIQATTAAEAVFAPRSWLHLLDTRSTRRALALGDLVSALPEPAAWHLHDHTRAGDGWAVHLWATQPASRAVIPPTLWALVLTDPAGAACAVVGRESGEDRGFDLASRVFTTVWGLHGLLPMPGSDPYDPLHAALFEGTVGLAEAEDDPAPRWARARILHAVIADPSEWARLPPEPGKTWSHFSVCAWASLGVTTPAEALAWHDLHLRPAVAYRGRLPWRRRGFTTTQAQRWAFFIDPQNPRPDEDAWRWHSAGCTPDQARAWAEVLTLATHSSDVSRPPLLTPQHVPALEAAGWTAQVTAWVAAASGPGWEERRAFLEAHIGHLLIPGRAPGALADLPTTPHRYALYLRAGFSREEIVAAEASDAAPTDEVLEAFLALLGPR